MNIMHMRSDKPEMIPQLDRSKDLPLEKRCDNEHMFNDDCQHSTQQSSKSLKKTTNGNLSYEKFTRVQLDAALKETFVELFVKFRDQKLTFSQLIARTFEKKGLAKYIVLDDIRHRLDATSIAPARKGPASAQCGKRGFTAAAVASRAPSTVTSPTPAPVAVKQPSSLI